MLIHAHVATWHYEYTHASIEPISLRTCTHVWVCKPGGGPERKTIGQSKLRGTTCQWLHDSLLACEWWPHNLILLQLSWLWTCVDNSCVTKSWIWECHASNWMHTHTPTWPEGHNNAISSVTQRNSHTIMSILSVRLYTTPHILLMSTICSTTIHAKVII